MFILRNLLRTLLLAAAVLRPALAALGAEKADTAAAIVPGQGLTSSDAERDHVLQQVTKIVKLSGVNLQPLASKHVTLWTTKDDRNAFLADIRKIEAYLEGKCQEPLRSGLDKRAAHVVLLKTRYDYEGWVNAMFEVMPDAFALPDGAGSNAELKASMLKWSGIYSHNIVIVCMEGQEEAWVHRLVAGGVGFMNFASKSSPAGTIRSRPGFPTVPRPWWPARRRSCSSATAITTKTGTWARSSGRGCTSCRSGCGRRRSRASAGC